MDSNLTLLGWIETGWIHFGFLKYYLINIFNMNGSNVIGNILGFVGSKSDIEVRMSSDALKRKLLKD